MPNSNDQPQSPGKDQSGPRDPPRHVGHELKCALADGRSAAERLLPHLVPGAAADAALADLRRALEEVEHVAEALLGRGAGAVRPAINAEAVVASLEPSLKQALGPGVSLTIKPSGLGVAVQVAPGELIGLVWRLVEGAVRAMPDGGELTISTGLLDHISVWPRSGYWPRRHIRLAVGDTSRGSYSEIWQRVLTSPPKGQSAALVVGSVAEIVGRLGGFLILESSAGEGACVHACLPAAPDMTKSPGTA